MIFILIVLAVLFVFSVGITLAKKFFVEPKINQPIFYFNSFGDKYAFCSILDFQRARAVQGQTYLTDHGHYVAVPETFISARPLFTGGTEFNPHLFIPTVSESFMTIEQQTKFFAYSCWGMIERSANTVAKFKAETAKKKSEALQADPLRRFAEWIDHSRGVDAIQKACYGFGIVWLCIVSFVVLNRNDKVQPVQAQDITLTEPNMIAPIRVMGVTRGERHKIAFAYDVDGMLNQVNGGPVVKVIPLGGDVTQVCIRASSYEIRCGQSSKGLNVQVGDHMYIRLINALTWRDDNGVDQNFNLITLALTKTEADVLASTGRFTVNEYK